MQTVLMSQYLGWCVSIHCSEFDAGVFTSVALVTPGDDHYLHRDTKFNHARLLGAPQNKFRSAMLSNASALEGARRYIDNLEN